MVKGVSRQVIVVQNPDPALFDQAIFILKEEAVEQGVTDEQLLREAKNIIRTPGAVAKANPFHAILWTGLGMAVTSLIWLITACVA